LKFPLGPELVVFERGEFVFVVSKAGFGKTRLFPFLLNLCTPQRMASTICIAEPLVLSCDMVFGFRDSGYCSLDFGRNCSLFDLDRTVSRKILSEQEGKPYM